MNEVLTYVMSAPGSYAMGAKIDFDWLQFERLCSLPRVITNEEVAWIIGCSVDTCENRIKERHSDATFRSFRDKREGIFRSKLLSKQFSVAMSGNPAMLIWLGKNYLGQRDMKDAVTIEKDHKNFTIILGNDSAKDEQTEEIQGGVHRVD